MNAINISVAQTRRDRWAKFLFWSWNIIFLDLHDPGFRPARVARDDHRSAGGQHRLDVPGLWAGAGVHPADSGATGADRSDAASPISFSLLAMSWKVH